MNIANINKYHQLKDIQVSVGQLLLDPQNPRLIVDLKDDAAYTGKQLISDQVQRDILNRINKDEYHVADLIKSIAQSGFINGTAPMLVKKIVGSSKYLVLEGNRRATAMKHLLEEPSQLHPSSAETLERIQVKEFIYQENTEFSEDEIIDVILGKIHITGALSWGPMEKAHYIFKSYDRELKKRGHSGFTIDKHCIDNVCEVYSFTSKDVRKHLNIYRVYDQLKSCGYEVESDRFTLIDLATSTTVLRNQYFELDEECQFSDVGLERFYNLCAAKPCPITNPQLFKKFVFIFKSGASSDVHEVEAGTRSVDDVHERVKQSKKGNQVLKRLEVILTTLENINLVEFRDTKEERYVAAKIVSIVNNKLKRLVTPIAGPVSNPKTIGQANRLSRQQLQKMVLSVVDAEPNKSCLERNVITKVLKFLKITTRGTPRADFKKKSDKEIDYLVKNGMLKRYNGSTGTRVKMLVS